MLIVGMVLVLVIVLLGTWRLAHRAAEDQKVASVAQFIWIAGGLVAVISAGVFGVFIGQQLWQYGRCVDSAESRNNFRATQLGFYDAVDIATGSEPGEGYYTAVMQVVVLEDGRVVSLRDALEINQPAKDPASCRRF